MNRLNSLINTPEFPTILFPEKIDTSLQFISVLGFSPFKRFIHLHQWANNLPEFTDQANTISFLYGANYNTIDANTLKSAILTAIIPDFDSFDSTKTMEKTQGFICMGDTLLIDSDKITVIHPPSFANINPLQVNDILDVVKMLKSNLGNYCLGYISEIFSFVSSNQAYYNSIVNGESILSVIQKYNIATNEYITSRLPLEEKSINLVRMLHPQNFDFNQKINSTYNTFINTLDTNQFI